MADILSIRNLAIECRIGVSETERSAPQTVWLDLELAINAKKAAAHDDVRDALDYAHLVELAAQHVQRGPVNLLETLAEDLATLILDRFATGRVTVRARKRALASIDYAQVELTRER